MAKKNKKPAPMPELQVIFSPRYSGPRSEEFWREVNRCNDSTLYAFACALQDVEARVLRELNRIVR